MKIKKYILAFSFLLSLTTYYLLLITPVLAQQIEKYTLLAPIPLKGELTSELQGKNIFETYIPGIFTTIIAFAAVLAVVRIIWGGILYISTDAIQGKSEGKKFITESIYGLILISAAWLILYTINPKLVNINLSITPIQVDSSGAAGGVCAGCQTISSIIPIKTGGGTSISPQMNSALLALGKEEMGGLGTNWQVTEAYPPTYIHSDPCHSSGTCVDANFISTPKTTQGVATSINTFISTASSKGLSAKYEVKTDAEKTALVNAGATASNISVNPNATGPHFHVKL